MIYMREDRLQRQAEVELSGFEYGKAMRNMQKNTTVVG